MSDEMFFERPRFWVHVLACLAYPFRLVRYGRQMRLLAANARRWQELARAATVPPGEHPQVRKTGAELRDELEAGRIIPDSSSGKTYKN